MALFLRKLSANLNVQLSMVKRKAQARPKESLAKNEQVLEATLEAYQGFLSDEILVSVIPVPFLGESKRKWDRRMGIFRRALRWTLEWAICMLIRVMAIALGPPGLVPVEI